MSSEDLKKFLSVFGPAWLVMIADVDVASIIEGIEAGVVSGAVMVLIMLILIPPLFFIQDAAGRLGSVGNIGFGEAIRKKYGKNVSLALSLPMALSDFLEYLAEFAGMAIGLTLLGLPVWTGLVVFYIVHLTVVFTRKYRSAEMILLPLSFLLVITLFVELFLFRPNFSILLNSLLTFKLNLSFFYLIAASIGAVIMPWMLFFHSGADARKHIGIKNMKYETLETLIGSVVSEALMAVVVIYGWVISFRDTDASLSGILYYLQNMDFALRLLMAVGFIASGLLALVVISMASAWGVVEAAELDQKHYVLIYLLESLPALFIAIFVRNYLQLILGLMVLYSVLLIPLLYVLGKTASDCSFMKGFALKGRRLKVYWAMAAAVSIGGIVGFVSFLMSLL
ncbi:MAG: NRAMP family divalent metal transporter [Nitrososphaeria archaeon]